eukprot:GILI01013658.1.p1 GENE.GILI01013658.1~~GILI01013658.1.p1  ORF type:complete len:256 (+),score=41.51 GILI01013658.1:61-768(+)
MSQPRSKELWQKFGDDNGLSSQPSWTPLVFRFPIDMFFWSTSKAGKYFESLLTHEANDMQEDVGSSLTATGIICVLILSVATNSFDNPMKDAHDNNLFGPDAAPYFAGISQICGIISFIMAVLGTFFTVNFYSQVVRVPVEAFPAFLQEVGPGTFGLIWFYPSVSLYAYFAAILLRVCIINHLWFGIVSVVLGVILLLHCIYAMMRADILHAKSVVIRACCLQEKEKNQPLAKIE